MIDLKHEMERELSQLDPPDLWDRIQADADAGDAAVLDLRSARRRQRPSLWLAVAAVTVLVVIVGALALLDDDQPVDTTPANEVPTPATTVPHRSGALRTGGEVHTIGFEGLWEDPVDTSEPWADLVRVTSVNINSGHWNLDLAGSPPFEGLEPGDVLGYGLVFDTNADGVADYEVGIDDGAPREGQFRAWVIDLSTGEKREQVGPPYGFPIEFRHPSEADGGFPLLTFLGGSAPADLNPHTVRFYAWTSVTRAGDVVAHDYAPDTGWITEATP